MIDRLVYELKRISETNEVFQFMQNNNEFLSIVFVISSFGFNAFLSVKQSPIRSTNTDIDVKIKSILDARQTFSDGSTFKSHFKDDLRIGMVYIPYILFYFC